MEGSRNAIMYMRFLRVLVGEKGVVMLDVAAVLACLPPRGTRRWCCSRQGQSMRGVCAHFRLSFIIGRAASTAADRQLRLSLGATAAGCYIVGSVAPRPRPEGEAARRRPHRSSRRQPAQDHDPMPPSPFKTQLHGCICASTLRGSDTVMPTV